MLDTLAKMKTSLLSILCAVSSLSVVLSAPPVQSKKCQLHPLGPGRDDTDQVEAAIAECGHFGTTVFASGSYNITRKMTWDLVSAKVDLHGYLNFPPDINYWLDAESTYRVVFIQNQASWFVVTGSDFEIDAHNTGGIQGNGQTWWSFYATRVRNDGDGRPISLTLYKVARGIISNFRIESPPFWSNAVVESSDVVYNGMLVNATNMDPLYVGQNIVWNTDGIDTYRSDRVSLLNWDVTCGDDCVAIKGNSTNISIQNLTCRGGQGIAIGSLGQYVDMPDNVVNVEIDTVQMIRLAPKIQPNMMSGIYFKSWDGSVNGAPPTGGGGANGTVHNVVVRNMKLDQVAVPVLAYQTNVGQPGDLPSKLKFGDLSFINWTGTANMSTLVDIECSPAAICHNISFENFHVTPPHGEVPLLICQNTADVTGLSAPCTPLGAT